MSLQYVPGYVNDCDPFDQVTSEKLSRPDRILFIAAEATPFVKVGGLGDVAGSLPRALRDLGFDLRLALPLHPQIERDRYRLERLARIEIPSRHGEIPAEVFYTEVDALPVYLVASPLIPAEGPVYSTDSGRDGPKFVHFCLAALAIAGHTGWQPDLIHANDWHTAVAPYVQLLRRESDPVLARTASLLTVHNLPYQGEGAGAALAEFGIPPATGSPLPWWAQDRPLALGLLAADHVNTVSPGYAVEMQTEAFGAGLDGFLRQHRAGRLNGILNGLDLAAWDPATDAALTVNYNRDNLKEKAANKAALQREAGLKVDPEIPLFGIVSRMDEQKGIDLAVEGLRLVRDRAWQAVILGTGNREIEAAAISLAEQNPGRARVWIDFNDALGRRIYAGADVFLIPSRYEPCGLTQMIAMRYGAVPLASAVGGLKDTVRDYSEGGDSTGFLFRNPSPFEFADAILRVIEVFGDRRRWRGLQLRGMKQDFSWDGPAKLYRDLYRGLIARRKEGS
ncbi:MAG TPA: glycogen/starch synthase [Anaerolineales bacterium]|nr:glycogen/starch synthase [Anaerolineales bacterium]